MYIHIYFHLSLFQTKDVQYLIKHTHTIVRNEVTGRGEGKIRLGKSDETRNELSLQNGQGQPQPAGVWEAAQAALGPLCGWGEASAAAPFTTSGK